MQDELAALTARMDSIESAMGGLAFDPQTLKGAPSLSQAQLEAQLDGAGAVRNASGQWEAADVLNAVLSLGNLPGLQGTYLLSLSEGQLAVAGFTDAVGSPAAMGQGDQMAFTIDENRGLLWTASNDQNLDDGRVAIPADPADALAHLNAQAAGATGTMGLFAFARKVGAMLRPLVSVANLFNARLSALETSTDRAKWPRVFLQSGALDSMLQDRAIFVLGTAPYYGLAGSVPAHMNFDKAEIGFWNRGKNATLRFVENGATVVKNIAAGATVFYSYSAATGKWAAV